MESESEISLLSRRGVAVKLVEPFRSRKASRRFPCARVWLWQAPHLTMMSCGARASLEYKLQQQVPRRDSASSSGCAARVVGVTCWPVMDQKGRFLVSFLHGGGGCVSSPFLSLFPLSVSWACGCCFFFLPDVSSGDWMMEI